MRLQKNPDGSVYLWLSARDTYDWASRPGRVWPCSTLAGNRIYAAFEANGDLVDLTVNGRYDDSVEIDGHELIACAADHLRARLPADHPLVKNLN